MYKLGISEKQIRAKMKTDGIEDGAQEAFWIDIKKLEDDQAKKQSKGAARKEL